MYAKEMKELCKAIEDSVQQARGDLDDFVVPRDKRGHGVLVKLSAALSPQVDRPR